MQSDYPAHFEREQGCTESEWLGWLPGAVGGQGLDLSAPGQARIDVGAGQLHIRWQPLPPRQIALMRMPRMVVDYRFDEHVTEDQRLRFMRYFDLYMQRGGG